MNSAEAIWRGACELLKKNMNPVSFSTWIENIRPVSIENDVITLMSENEMGKRTLQNVYSSSVTAAVNACSNTMLKVRFVDSSDASRSSEDAVSVKSGAPMLNAKYTFDTFVVGESNRFAHAAALAVAENPANAYNPLFIYGGVGLGKTHLMHAIGHVVYANNNSARILYVTCETFTNELIESIRDKRMPEFRNKYRNIDILMIDDIQFIAGKESTQDEIFHTFNTLYTANKQIILTSDKPPKNIPTLESRLTSRFECGLVADVKPPDFETRAAILRKKADSENMDVSDNVLYYIAEKIESNIRELEGSLTRVIAHSKLTGDSVDVVFAEKVLADLIQSHESGHRLTPLVIMQAVSDYYRISVDDILGKKRDKHIAMARQMSMFLCRKLMGMSFEEIGGVIGGKHYTTVMHACDKISQESRENRDVRLAIEDVEYRLRD